VLGRKRAPEFEAWLRSMQIIDNNGSFTLSPSILDRLLPQGSLQDPL
jgi:hypothetical protein